MDDEQVRVVETITLDAVYPKGEEQWGYGSGFSEWDKDSAPRPPLAEGMIEIAGSYQSEGETHTFTVLKYDHEFAAPRYFKDSDDVILNFGGQNYFLHVNVSDENRHDGIPESAKIILSPTSKPETLGHKWDREDAVKKHLLYLRKELNWAKNNPDEYQDADDHARWVKRLKERLENFIEEPNVSHPFAVQVFGKPAFIQSSIFPVHNAKLAFNLVTLETGWGDSGNINIMFACDESGTPCKAWFEASCA